MTIDKINWRPLGGDADLPGLAALAARCAAADGGLPQAATEPFLARRYAAPGAVSMTGVDESGEIVAAAAVRPERLAIGLVDPRWRGRGIGGHLVDWCLRTATELLPTTDGEAAGLTVETESLTESAATLFASRGLRQVFAEQVMSFDLVATPIPEIPLPGGVTLTSWSPDLAERFHAVYHASFRERPAFPGWSVAQWVEWLTDDEEFRPEWTLLATVEGAAEDGDADGDVGFIGCAEGWIVQVGVRPDWRGCRLGAALVTEALRRMREAGLPHAMLDFNVNNPRAGRLYQALGFTMAGTRARFRPA